MTVRLPAHAGRFYPRDPATLTRDVDGYLQAGFRGVVPPAETVATTPKALVVPHAGYMFSGPVAGAGYAQLHPPADTIRRVVLLGPAHYVPVASIATTGADVWRTPLGDVPVDDELRRVALGVPGVVVDDEPHTPEHSLEVHLPFLQRVLGDFRLLPLVVGRADPETVAALLDAVWGGPETLVVVSTDLSHYLDHDTAATRDRATAERILDGRTDELDPYDACGAHPLRGLMVEADRLGLRTRLVALCNSGDTSGPRDRVVGYGAFAVEAAPTGEEAALDADRRAALLGVAVDAVATGLRSGDEREPAPQLLDDPVLGAPGAAFVTLEREGRLLGCVGGLEPLRPLASAVARGAYAAAFEDPRLPAVDTDDYREMTVKVSVLSTLEPFAVESYDDLVARLRPGVDGVVVADRHRRATLLPSVWRQLPEPAGFVAALWQKAGLRPGSWPEGVRLLRYTTVEFTDPGPRPALT
jgi:MEMO1 family protein